LSSLWNFLPLVSRLIRPALLLAALAPLAALHAQSNYATPYTFTTFAGTAGSSGSADGTGNAAQFHFPYGAAVDGSGNVYVADTYNNTIRKITSGGSVTTFAGTAGRSGSADGTGSTAQFKLPSGVAADAAGNIYVADSGNYTIRKITAAGVVTTLFGTAGSGGGTGSTALDGGPIGVAVDGAGNVYVTFAFTIWKITAAGVVTDFSVNAARFNFPYGVAVDGAGNVYVADTGNHTIRKITAAGVVTTLAGTAGRSGSADGTGSTAQFSLPFGIAVDGTGNVYVAEVGNDTIRQITPTGVVTTLAGSAGTNGSTDGMGSAARFNNPFGVAVDGSGAVYIADSGNFTIRKGVDPRKPMITTQPVGASVVVGQSFNLSVTATGLEPITYQWRKNNVDVAAATGATLSLTNFQASDLGVYSVVISNAFGSVTSSGAILRVSPTDFNGDGRSDPLWRNAGNGEIRTWVPIGGSIGFGAEAGGWTVIGVGDFDGDGRAEPLWRNASTGLIASWTSGGGYRSFGTEGGGWSVLTVGDFDGDGRAEPLWRNASTGEIRTWFPGAGSACFGAEGGGWSIIAVGDFDGIGRTEPLWQNISTGVVASWTCSGTYLTFSAEGGGWSVIGVGDFDGDGRAEPLWRNVLGGEIRTWFVGGGSLGFGTESGGWSVLAVGDFDGDGRAEPLWRNTNTGAVAAWTSNGTNLPFGTEGGGWSVIK
jgi:sugar lactone lactonase YvrE